MKLDKFNIVDTLTLVSDPITGQDIISSQKLKDINIENNSVQITVDATGWSANDKANFNFKCMEALQKAFSGVDFNIHFKTVATKEQATNTTPQIKNIIAVASGKGGVGKSTISLNLAQGLQKQGYAVGILDADLYGPSLPTMLGTAGMKPEVRDVYGKHKLVALESKGLAHLSLGYIVEPDQAVVLRGPRLAGIIKQFFEDTIWPPLDILIIDLPPGTGDIHLTLLQTVAVTGAVMVTTPQSVAVADARKAANMFMLESVKVPILGVVENMSWFTPEELPDNKYFIFGKGGGEELATFCETSLLGQIPLIQGIREHADQGTPAVLSNNPILHKPFDDLATNVLEQLQNRNQNQAPSQIIRTEN